LASAGIGSPEHVAGELFMMMTGIDMLHVPYRGSAPAVTDLVGGHVQVYFGPIAPSIEHIKAGQLRALAVTTTARSSALPDTPSIAEHLPSFDVSAWQGIGAPKGTPASVIESLNQQINAVLLGADLRVRLNELGLRPIPGSPADFARLIAQDTEKWAKVVMTAGIKAD
jgi:tripartite-type tricarboxylate transporter receptor subunit TctC